MNHCIPATIVAYSPPLIDDESLDTARHMTLQRLVIKETTCEATQWNTILSPEFHQSWIHFVRPA